MGARQQAYSVEKMFLTAFKTVRNFMNQHVNLLTRQALADCRALTCSCCS